MPHKSVCDVISEIDPNPSDSNVMKQMVLGIACFDAVNPLTAKGSPLTSKIVWR